MPGARLVRGPHREVAGALRCFPGNGLRFTAGPRSRSPRAGDRLERTAGTGAQRTSGGCGAASRCQRADTRSGRLWHTRWSQVLARDAPSHGDSPSPAQQSLDRVFVERHVQVGACHPPCGALAWGQGAVAALGAWAGVHQAPCGAPSPIRAGSQLGPGLPPCSQNGVSPPARPRHRVGLRGRTGRRDTVFLLKSRELLTSGSRSP